MARADQGWLTVAPATDADLEAVKQLADAHRHELGFLVRASLAEACRREGLFVACAREQSPDAPPAGAVTPNVVGFVQVHFRRDSQTTLHSIAVDTRYRFRGVGSALVDAILHASSIRGKRFILLRCPVELPANSFYERMGFVPERIELGKRRKLTVWTYSLGQPGPRASVQ